MLPFYARELIDLGVSHFTETINAVDPEIGAKIYRHIDYLGTRYTGTQAASILLANQLACLKNARFRRHCLQGQHSAPEGHQRGPHRRDRGKIKELGAYVSNIMQLIPVKGSAFEDIELVSNKDLDSRSGSGMSRKSGRCIHCSSAGPTPSAHWQTTRSSSSAPQPNGSGKARLAEPKKYGRQPQERYAGRSCISAMRTRLYIL
jgi:hypothetical protein